MNVSYAEVISKCMSLGMMVSINQRLEADVIELVAGEFGYTVEFIGIDDAAEMEDENDGDDPEDLVPRSADCYNNGSRGSWKNIFARLYPQRKCCCR